MARNHIITGIDLGTDKCATVIAQVDPETGALSVSGVSVVSTRGMRRSQIVNLEQVIDSVSESLDGAERMAGVTVEQAYVSLSGSHISSRNSKGVVAVSSPSQEITSGDVSRVIEAARAISIPPEKEILHVIPRDFSIDAQHGIKDPVGMTGIRLEAETHVITGMSTAMRNIAKSIHDVGVDIQGFVFSGLAASYVTLTETEKELGVVLVDIGAGTTSYAAYVDGSLTLSGALPVGARHITQDIALGSRISLDAAEQVKLLLSEERPDQIKPLPGESKSDLQKRRKAANEIDLTELGITGEAETLSRKTLIDGIMVPRMTEIFNLLGQALHEADLIEAVPAGLVLTGGGARTVKITETAKRTLNLPARVAAPSHFDGIVNDMQQPSFATTLGLIEHANRHGGAISQKQSWNPLSFLDDTGNSGLFTAARQFMQQFLP